MSELYEVKIYSSIGRYPPASIDFGDSKLVVDHQIVYSVIPVEQKISENYFNLSGMTVNDIRIAAACILGSFENLAFPYLTAYMNFKIEAKDCGDVFSEGSKDLIKNKFIQKIKDVPQQYSPILESAKYDFLPNKSFDRERYILAYQAIDIKNVLLLRGLKSIVRSKMLWRDHYPEEAAIMMYIAAEALLESEAAKIQNQSGIKIKLTDMISKLENRFPFELKKAEGMMEEMNNHRVQSLHPKSRLGIFLHPELEADDYFDNFYWLVKIYEYFLMGNVLFDSTEPF